jgi:N-acetylglucosaminyldiphosphoundecaprenol N-acetyl-beta-D-mannosaminyltransferase
MTKVSIEAHPAIFGIPVAAISMDDMLDMIDGWIASNQRRFICTADVHALTESQTHNDIRRIYASEAVVVPDGMPIVWFLRYRGWAKAERICGPDLMPALFRRSEDRGYRHFLYGATELTLTRLRARLGRDYPRGAIAGACSPPFRELPAVEDAQTVAMINGAEPDIVWVGLGAPKQDRWMAAHRAALRAPVLIGVGAAFDMLAGNVPRAPRILQRTGCEWMFRVAREPRRLGKRYLKSNSLFAVRLCKEMLHKSKAPTSARPAPLVVTTTKGD